MALLRSLSLHMQRDRTNIDVLVREHSLDKLVKNVLYRPIFLLNKVLWSEETMSERSRLSSIRRAYAGRSSASSRHLSLHPNATWREGFSTPAAASLGASQVNMFGTTSPESPDALSSWYMTKQAGKRKTNGDGVSAAAPARHESRFPRKRLHVGKEMKPGASVYPGLTKPLRENETPLDWRDGVDSDDDYVCEKFFRRIGVTNKKELERVLKKIMKSSGAKGKGSKVCSCLLAAASA